jgi:hypothetical protein
MLEGFRAVVPNGADIVISQESATYRPEMEWLAARLNEQAAVAVAGGGDSGSVRDHNRAGISDPGYSWRVMPAENYEPHDGRAVYRFFEPFDLPNISGSKTRCAQTLKAASPSRRSNPISKKMWFALFWLELLREFWRRELGDNISSSCRK